MDGWYQIAGTGASAGGRAGKLGRRFKSFRSDHFSQRFQYSPDVVVCSKPPFVSPITDGRWNQILVYIFGHSRERFTHCSVFRQGVSN